MRRSVRHIIGCFCSSLHIYSLLINEVDSFPSNIFLSHPLFLPPVCINLVWKVDFIPTVLQADITAVSLELRPAVWSRPAAHTD